MSTQNEACGDFADITKSTAQLTQSTKASTRERLKRVLRRVSDVFSKTTVEPCLSLYMVSTAISSLAVMNLNQEKACRVNYAYGNETCSRIRMMAGNMSDIMPELANVQKAVADAMSWKFPLQTGIPALMLLFVGAWSDRTGKRKVCMLAPMVGEMITNAGLLLATHFMHEWSLFTTILIEALPAALTGGWIFMFMGMFSYMTDITTMKNRTFRLGVATVCVTLGTPTGTALSGILLRYLGYYGVFSLLLCFHAIAFTYGLIRIKDVKMESKQDVSGSWCKTFIAIKPVVDTVMVLFKKRHGSRQLQIVSVLILYFLMVGPLYGDSAVSYMYAQYKFNFSEVEYSLFSTLNVVLALGGTILCVVVLIRTMRVEDSAIGILAGASRIAACLVFAFAPSRDWYYAAPAVNIFSPTGLTAVRSMSSKLVPNDEVAKLSSLLGVAEALAPSVYMPISSAIYKSSLETLPGAFYLFDATLTVLAVLLFAMSYWLKRREVQNDNGNDVLTTEISSKKTEISRL